MWWKPQLFKETLVCFCRRVCRLLEFAVHIRMQIRMLDFPRVLCEQLLLLTWKLFYFPCLTIVFVWVIRIPETRCATLDVFPLLNAITYCMKLEAGTVGLCCTLHDLGVLHRPAGLVRQNTVCCKESMGIRHCYTSLEMMKENLIFFLSMSM